MHLVFLIKAGRKQYNGMILWIFWLLLTCSLALSKRADGQINQNDPAGSRMHVSISPEEASTRSGEEHVGSQSRSADIRTDRENPVLAVPRKGWFNTTSAAVYFAQDKGYQIQSTVGYRFRYRYTAGLGVAIDQYTYRTFHVFGDFQGDLNLHKTTPFAYVDPGITFPWLKRQQYPYNGKPDNTAPGGYLNVGVGQKLRLGTAGESLELSAGYSLETLRLRYREHPNPPDPPVPDYGPLELQREAYRFVFNRIVLQLGVTL